MEWIRNARRLADKIGWWNVLLTTGCLSGYFSLEPGTAGTVVAVPLYLLLAPTGWIPYTIVTLLLFALGVRGAKKVETATGQHDSRIIVIDEVVGYLITMLFLPQRWLYVILGFGLFRLFDCWKPYPIYQFDKNPMFGTYGVMLDDVLAGIYGNILLQILVKVTPV